MQRLFGVSLALERRAAADPAERERCRVEMQEALERPAPRARAPAGAAAARDRDDARRRARAARGRSPGAPVRVDWPAGVAVPADLEPLAPVGAGRGAAQRRQARQRRRGSTSPSARDDDTFTLEVRNDGARPAARATPGWACAWPRSRRCSRAAWSSSGRPATTAGGCGWSCRCEQRARDERAASAAGSRRPPPAGAGRRRPRRRPLGLSRAARRAAVGRALPGGADRRRGARADADASSRTWRWSTCSSPASRAPTCASRSARPRRRRGCC